MSEQDEEPYQNEREEESLRAELAQNQQSF